MTSLRHTNLGWGLGCWGRDRLRTRVRGGPHAHLQPFEPVAALHSCTREPAALTWCLHSQYVFEATSFSLWLLPCNVPNPVLLGSRCCVRAPTP